ncbi:hydrogenase 2 maturation endopeptidase [Salmonella enterica subsp. enterica serovar Choleraesuis]|nr:hydrogenase 2 maturation endopeptidase [Salmonella enterica subsp. enterica serovar Choleraesuis]
MAVLITGIGNLLLSDEGVGVRAVEALEARYRFPDGVDLLDGGTSGMELLEAMASRKLLIVIDAVRSDYPPGSVFVLEDEEVPAFFSQRVSPHQLGLADVLMALKLTDEFPQRLVLVGIEPESLAPGMSLSDCASKALELAVEQVISLLQQAGITPVLREESDAG